jgi:hypothetical protein
MASRIRSQGMRRRMKLCTYRSGVRTPGRESVGCRRAPAAVAVSLALVLPAGPAACADQSAQRFEGDAPPAHVAFEHDALSLPVDTLRGRVVLDSADLVYPRDIEVSERHLFVLERHAPPALRVFETDGWTSVSEAGGRGEGPGEVGRMPRQVLIAPSGDVWVYDASLRRLTRFYSQESGDTPWERDTLVVPLQSEAPLLSLGWLDEEVMVATGLFRLGQLGLVSVKGSVTEIGGEPPGDPDIWIQFRNQLNEGDIAVHPSRDRFAVGRRHAGRLEIFDREGRLRGSAAAPFPFESPFTLNLHGQGAGGISWGADKRTGYASVAATERGILALFSGRTVERYGSVGHSLGRYIHEFDWSGKLRRVYWLDGPEAPDRIAVDPDSRRIFALYAFQEVPTVREFVLDSDIDD